MCIFKEFYKLQRAAETDRDCPEIGGGRAFSSRTFLSALVEKLPGAISLPHSSSETHLHDSARTHAPYSRGAHHELNNCKVTKS
jgi:hypothetical protein